MLDRTGLTRSTLYRKIENRSFPTQVRLNPRCVGWWESTIIRRIADAYGYSADNDNNAPNGRAVMEKDKAPSSEPLTAANDNLRLPISSAQVDATLKRIARLLGR